MFLTNLANYADEKSAKSAKSASVIRLCKQIRLSELHILNSNRIENRQQRNTNICKNGFPHIRQTAGA